MTTRLFKRTMNLLSIQKRNKRNPLKKPMVSASCDLDFDMEALENRQMLAGNVTAVLAGNNLTIVGDGEDNQISISQSGSQITVEGFDDTNIIFGGEDSSSHLINLDSNSLKNLTIVMKGGDDSVDVSEVEVSRDLKMVGDGGDDSFTGNNLAIGRNIIGEMGGNADYFSVNQSGVGGDVQVNLGGTPNHSEARVPAGDRFEIRETRVSGNVSVEQRSNRGSFDVTATDIGGDLSVSTGKGSDSFSLYDSNVSGDVAVNLGSSDSDEDRAGYGSDRADFGHAEISGDLTVAQSANRGEVRFYQVNVDGALTVETGNGSDQVGNNGGVRRSDSDQLSVGGNATIDLGSSGDGQDTLYLEGANFDGDLNISQASGDSSIRLTGYSYFAYDNDVYVGGDLNVSTSSGDDWVAAYSYGRFGSYGSLTVDGNATINLGSSNSNSYSDRNVGRGDFFGLTSTQISGDLTVIQAAKSGAVGMGSDYYGSGVNVDGDLYISMGAGDDWVGVYAHSRYLYMSSPTALTVGGNAEMDLGAATADGSDRLSLTATNISGDLTIRQTGNQADIDFGGYNNYYYYYPGTRNSESIGGVVVGNDLNISTGGGSDRVQARYYNYVDNRAPGGSGNAIVVGGNATIDLGSAAADGSDRLTLTATDISGDLTIGQTGNQAEINLGGYNNNYYYYYYHSDRTIAVTQGVVVGNDLNISTGRGSDRVQAYYYNYNRDAGGLGHAIVVSGNARIDLGSSDHDEVERGLSGDSAYLELVDVEGDLVIVQTAKSGDIRLNSVYVNGDTIINTGSGNDFVDIDDYGITRGFGGEPDLTLRVDMGSGDDGVRIDDVVLGDAEIILGRGDDDAYLYNVVVQGDFFVDMGRDRDMVDLENSDFLGSLEFIGGDGFDSVDFNEVSILGSDPVFEEIEEINGFGALVSRR